MAPRRNRNSALLVVRDRRGELVFRLNNLGDLFSDEQEQQQITMRRLPRPVRRLELLDKSAIAASRDGARIFAANESRVIVHGGGGSGTTHKLDVLDLHAEKPQPIILAAKGSDDVLVTTHDLMTRRQEPHFEALRLQRCGRWLAVPLAPPPWDLSGGDGAAARGVLAYCVVGSRAWLSVHPNEGTFCLDMARGVWCKEWGSPQDWPVQDRVVYVPPVHLHFGFNHRRPYNCSSSSSHSHPWTLRAFRMGAVSFEQEWSAADLLPADHDYQRYPVRFSRFVPHVVYLGGNRLCISWCSDEALSGHAFQGRLLALTGIQVTRARCGQVLLRKLNTHFYRLSRDQNLAYLL